MTVDSDFKFTPYATFYIFKMIQDRTIVTENGDISNELTWPLT